MVGIFDTTGRPVGLGQVIGRGGEACIYRIAGRPEEVAKLYEPAPRPEYPEKLAWMVSHPPLNPTQRQQHPSLAWPSTLLFDARGKPAGYTMPFIHPAVSLLDVFNPRRRAAILPRFDRRYLHRTARNLAAAVGALHACGYVAGDLNESNVLVTPSALVAVIDTDSFQVTGQSGGRQVVYPCPVGKLEYLPPELQGRPLSTFDRAPAQDSFTLAVLIFQLLMEGNHPFRAQWLGKGDPPSIEERIAHGAFPYSGSPQVPVTPPRLAPALNQLHPALVELFRRCFIDGHASPGLRPAPFAWERALIEAEESLVACPRGHIYSGHLGACPVCPPVPLRAARPARPAAPASSRPADNRPAAPSPRPVQPAPRPAPKPAQRASRPPVSPARSVPGWSIRQSPRQPLMTWVGPRILKSVLVGGGLGAAAGALPAVLLAVASHSAGETAALALLVALGGACGGLLRGWEPGYRLGTWMGRYLRRPWIWQALGMFAGGGIGLMMGMVFWWAVFPVILGLILGARVGAEGGKLLWMAAKKIGWGRIWAALGGLTAGYLGWQLGGWAARGGLDQLIFSWLPADPSALAWTWLLGGALCGALGGGLAGAAADFLARMSGLRD